MRDGRVWRPGAVVKAAKTTYAARSLGAEEAVLMDSGFSTALVYEGKVLASGHASPSRPSQPVSHAIIVRWP